jgi:phosphate transport system permease protein
VTLVGGPAGQLPATPQAARRTGPVRRAAEAIRGHEETGWRIAVLVPLAALVFAITVLAIKAYPAIKYNGFGFLTRRTWNAGGSSAYAQPVYTNGVEHPASVSYGAWALIVGTVQTSFIAVLLALPISIGAAFALTERLPRWIARPLGFAVELLAGIPSVIFGLWGILTLGPFLAKHVYPIVADHMPDVPVLRYFRQPVGSGEGLLTAGIVLALMIVPIITATTRDLFLQVPPLPKEGATALGMTDSEVARRVTLPWVRSGIIGATVLGLGRALGETIAVAMISGSIITIASNVYSPMTTIAATIVSQLDGAETDGTGFAVATLAEVALVLAVISVVVNITARIIITHTSRLGAPLGA